MFDIWNGYSELAEKVYRQNNYRIQINRNHITVNKPVCVVYCSSNNIWFPNDKLSFEKSLIKEDHYEWTKFHVGNVEKEIWIRDIYKSWYVTGVNREINTIEKLVHFLSIKTKGYRVITVGSSAGGYIASLLAKELNADFALCFSAQFDLRQNEALDKNPFLQKYNNTERSKYFNLGSYLLDCETDIFYIYPTGSKQDINQYNTIKNNNKVHALGLQSKRHGIVVYKCNLPILLSYSKKELIDIFSVFENQKVFPLIFSIRISGTFATISYLVREFFKFVIRWPSA